VIKIVSHRLRGDSTARKICMSYDAPGISGDRVMRVYVVHEFIYDEFEGNELIIGVYSNQAQARLVVDRINQKYKHGGGEATVFEHTLDKNTVEDGYSVFCIRIISDDRIALIGENERCDFQHLNEIGNTDSSNITVTARDQWHAFDKAARIWNEWNAEQERNDE